MRVEELSLRGVVRIRELTEIPLSLVVERLCGSAARWAG